MFCVLGFTLLLILTRADALHWPVREFRGIWVASVSNIDWPSSCDLSTNQQKTELITILDKLQQLNFNAVILQIRAAGDAFYNSDFEPWSVFLTGLQGRAPNPFYDPLRFAVEEAHKRNIELHAWFNPYRARSGSSSKLGLSSNHIVNRFPRYAYAYGDNVIMDPGVAEIQNFIFDVFMDVVRRYDIDGVHIDDYFYPYPVSGQIFPDSDTYRTYTNAGGAMSLANWRRHNVDTLIQRLANGIKDIKSYVKFGISPFGIWQPGHPSGITGLNSYSELYGNSRKWLQEGWVDYLAPQIYWRIDPPQQCYTALLGWWTQQNPQKHHLYIGNYAGKVVHQNWPIEEIRRQVDESRKRRNSYSLGNIQFSMKYFRDNIKGISDMFMDLYNYPALAPVMPWLSATEPVAPSGVKINNGNMTWNRDTSNTVRSWVLYKLEADSYRIVNILSSDKLAYPITAGDYSIAAINRLGTESSHVGICVPAANVR